MNDQLRTELVRLEAEIAALVTECDVPLQEATSIREYLEHNEPGTALESLCDTLIEIKTPLTESQCRRILDAAKSLGMLKREPKEWSQRMEALLEAVR